MRQYEELLFSLHQIVLLLQWLLRLDTFGVNVYGGCPQ